LRVGLAREINYWFLDLHKLLEPAGGPTSATGAEEEQSPDGAIDVPSGVGGVRLE
jgi:hypothetical protein